MKSRTFLTLLSISILNLFILGCGKDNEVDTPPPAVVPLKPIALQPKNLLGPFDPSFEDVEMVERRNPRIRIVNSKYFRVTGSSRRGQGVDVSDFAAYDGKKSLRLLEAGKQSLVIPTSERGRVSQLKVQSGSRYRFSANIRFPRQVRNRPSGQVILRLRNGSEVTGEVVQGLSVAKRDPKNWHLISAEIEIPSQVDNAKLVIQVDGSDDLLIDNLIFIKLR